MNTPSSTIQAATMASACVTAFWELLMTFTAFEPTALLIGSSITIVSGIVGYIKKEKTLKLAKK